ncbi:MAG TPA: peptide chain release factor N(5)-glutamine methyltransferase [Candidatus Saccharibacteria bacterium]|nr:peptide chain release factor N(5)-glutamine methyltransferase [Candidatus Saccharibacteria bacterium]
MNKNSYQTTLEKALSSSELALKSTLPDSARLDCQLITAHVLGKPRSWVISHGDFVLSTPQIRQIERLTKLRQENTPIAYILNEKEFYRRKFYCDDRALIPRPESEQIISSMLDILPKTPLSIIDVGCGSGVLGITAKLENPNWQLTLSDISKQAIDVATRNVKNFGLSSNVSIIQYDLLPTDKYYDVVIANLPYVPTNLIGKSDISFEPKMALFAGEDGLDSYRQLFAQLQSRRDRPTFLFIESHSDQQAELINMAQSCRYSLIKKTKFTLALKQN